MVFRWTLSDSKSPQVARTLLSILVGDRGSVLGRVIPKNQKMVFDTSLLNTQHYKARIKIEVDQTRELSSALPYISV